MSEANNGGRGDRAMAVGRWVVIRAIRVIRLIRDSDTAGWGGRARMGGWGVRTGTHGWQGGRSGGWALGCPLPSYLSRLTSCLSPKGVGRGGRPLPQMHKHSGTHFLAGCPSGQEGVRVRRVIDHLLSVAAF